MKKQLLIAGGGIGGLAAALGAARAGWGVRLYERAAAFSEIGAGIQLGPNVVRCLEAWGLQQPLHAVAAFPDRLQVRSAVSGQELAVLPLGATALQRYGAAYATIHRADLHGLLLAALTRDTDTQLHLAQAVERFSDADGLVTVHTSRAQEVTGDALIGADGLWSRTRAQLLVSGCINPAAFDAAGIPDHRVANPRHSRAMAVVCALRSGRRHADLCNQTSGAAAPRMTGHLAYRALLLPSALPDALRAGQITVWLGPHLHVVHYPVRRGELHNLVVIVQGPAPQDLERWDQSANAADLEQALQRTCTALQDLVRSVSAGAGNRNDSGPPWQLWPLCDRPPVPAAEAMARGLVGLLGDAAHPMLPYLAQGAGMAIEDAAELEQALALPGLSVPQRLHRYAIRRWQRNARVQARSTRNGRIFHATGALRWARDLSLRLLGQRLLDMPWLYRGANSPGP